MIKRFLILMLLLPISLSAGEVTPGKSIGAKASEKPHWFKESFLDFEEDVKEATESSRRVMLYFHQDSCPYCARLVEENFSDPETESFIRQNFDGITLNMWGDRDVISISGQNFTEKTFAAALKVQYTPTLIFLDESGKVALRLNGYYPPNDFRAALRYVAAELEKKMSFNQYRASLDVNPSNELIDEDFFQADTNLQQLIKLTKKPLAVYFETGNCVECVTLHERILTDNTTRQLVKTMNNAQLAIYSDREITTPTGLRTTSSAWARKLNISYTPSLVFFDINGNEVMRLGGFVKTFHFQSIYAYVLEKGYIEKPSFQRYIAERAEHIRELGFDTDIWGYQSFHE